MIRLRSIEMPGTLRGAEPVATMMSRRARSVCVSPSNTSTPPFPVSRAVPLIHSILFFLNRNSTPLVKPLTIRSFLACTCVMKLTIIKKATKTAKPQGWCPVYIDDSVNNK